MFWAALPGRARLFRNVATVAILAIMVLAGVPGFAGSPAAHSASASPTSIPVTGHAAKVGAPSSGASAHVAPTVHPQGTPTTTLSFWANNTTFASSSITQGPDCRFSMYSFNYSGTFYNETFNYCYSDLSDPSVLHLANGDLGMAYGVNVNTGFTTCPTAQGYNMTERVGFSISPDGGKTFGPMSLLFNGTSCSYLDAMEPSFTVASSGNVYGVYVEGTASTQPWLYTSRASDALGFTASSNNGATFSTPTQITTAGNIARPQIVTFGDTIYVMYENIANGTSTFSYGTGNCCANPISLNVVSSTDGGSTWSAPSTLWGENSSTGYSTIGGWLEVNATGTLGVSYFTNQSCVNAPYGYCYNFGDDLVFSTSTNNGSTWSLPVTVTGPVGESQYYNGFYSAYAYFEGDPNSQFAFSPDGTMAYIAFSGTYSKGSPYYYYNWNTAGVFESTGPTVGSSGWSTRAIATTSNYYNYDNMFMPAIGIVGSTIYLAFGWENTTYCPSTCAPGQYSYGEWETTSTDGVTWESTSLLDYIHNTYYSCYGYYCDESWIGYHSSIGSLNASYPVFGYVLGTPYSYTFNYFYTGTGYNYYYNYTYANRLEASFPYTGPTISLNVTENGLTPGTTWSFELNGGTVTTNSQSIFVLGIPPNQVISVSGVPVSAGYRTQIAATISVPGETSFSSNSTIYFNFSYTYGIQFFIQPADCAFCEVELYDNGSWMGYYAYADNCVPNCGSYPYAYPAFPWYFHGGTQIEVETYGDYGLGSSYWNGTGPGTYTAASLWANVTVLSAFNETAWWGGFGAYTVQVNPIGLPSTSTYTFSFDGVPYSAAGGQTVNISGVATGVHTVTDISATSTTAGWEYFGYSTPSNPVLVPAAPIVNLSFAYVNVGSTAGTVTFAATGISMGTVWHFGFNGTIYSSDTPWINVTAQTGTYPILGYPITALNTSVGYTPSGLTPTLSVTPGSTYTVNFVDAYKVVAVAGTGGSITGGGTFWMASGATASFHATIHTNYAFGGWTGTGLGSYSGPNSYANVTVGGPIVETAVFYPLSTARFNLTLAETGLAPGTVWTVFLGGAGYSSNASSFQISGLYACGNPLGNYALTVPYAYASDGMTRFVPTAHLASVICTTGTTVINEVFTTQYFLSISSTVGGYAQATVGAVTSTTGLWAPDSAPIELSAIALPGYQFLGWNGTGPGSYSGAGFQWSIAITGPASELAVFAQPVTPPPARYSLDFHLATSVAPGTSWSITLGGVGYSSTTSDLIATGLLAGSYTLTAGTALSPDGLTRYSPNGVATSVTITHNTTLQLSYATSYWVTVVGSVGGTILPASTWVVAGSSISLSAAPLDGYVFLGWTGVGTNAYSGTDENHTVTVTSPVTETASFRLASVSLSNSGGSSSSFWSQPTSWILFAIVGLVVGLVVGLIVSRRNRSPPPIEPASEAAPSDGSSDASGGSQ
jgi:hypothetical protein